MKYMGAFLMEIRMRRHEAACCGEGCRRQCSFGWGGEEKPLEWNWDLCGDQLDPASSKCTGPGEELSLLEDYKQGMFGEREGVRR